MDRRIRVKCPECAASIEMRVDQEELVDVKCPRCQRAFTAKVPPPAVEVIEIAEPVEEAPPVRMTRVVQPAEPRPRVRQAPQRMSAPASDSFGSWQAPAPQYQPAPKVSGAMHLKAFLIASSSVIGLGVLIMVGILLKSAISNIQWSSPSDDSGNETSVASSASTDGSSSGSATASNAESGETDNARIQSKVMPIAMSLVQATQSGNYEVIVDNTLPSLVKAVGGRRKFLDMTRDAMQQIKSSGAHIDQYTVSENVTIMQKGKYIYVILPTQMDLSVQGKRIRTESYLLAVSENRGRTYGFLDGSGAAKNPSMLKKLVPHLPSTLPLPASSPPREIP